MYNQEDEQHRKVPNGWVYGPDPVITDNSDAKSVIDRIEKICERNIPGVAAYLIYDLIKEIKISNEK